LGGCPTPPLVACDLGLFRGEFLRYVVLGQEVLEDAGIRALDVVQRLRILDIVVPCTELLPNDLEDEKSIPPCLLNDVLNGEVHILTTISEAWVLVAHRVRLLGPDPCMCSERAFL
jgi:hypothetical protein